MKKTSVNLEIIPDFSCVQMMRNIRDQRDREMAAMTRSERLQYLGIKVAAPKRHHKNVSGLLVPSNKETISADV